MKSHHPHHHHHYRHYQRTSLPYVTYRYLNSCLLSIVVIMICRRDENRFHYGSVRWQNTQNIDFKLYLKPIIQTLICWSGWLSILKNFSMPKEQKEFPFPRGKFEFMQMVEMMRFKGSGRVAIRSCMLMKWRWWWRLAICLSNTE